MTTLFSFHCSGWVDPDEEISINPMFRFTLSHGDSEDEQTLFYEGRGSELNTRGVFLSEGSSESDHYYDIHVTITDPDGASAKATIPVQVCDIELSRVGPGYQEGGSAYIYLQSYPYHNQISMVIILYL